MEPTFIPANPVDHRDALVALNVEARGLQKKSSSRHRMQQPIASARLRTQSYNAGISLLPQGQMTGSART